MGAHNQFAWSREKFDNLIERSVIYLYIALEAVLSLAAGILILVMPIFLDYIVAAYLIIYGLLGMLR